MTIKCNVCGTKITKWVGDTKQGLQLVALLLYIQAMYICIKTTVVCHVAKKVGTSHYEYIDRKKQISVFTHT